MHPIESYLITFFSHGFFKLYSPSAILAAMGYNVLLKMILLHQAFSSVS